MVATGKRTAEEHRDIGAKKGKFDRNSQPRKPFAGKSDAKKSFSKSGPGGKPAWQNNKKDFKNKSVKTNPFGVKRENDQKYDKPNDDQKQTTSTEKMDWNKYKQQKKELKMKRKGSKDLFDLTTQAKKIYENLKCKSTKDKDVICRELHVMLRNGDNYQKLVMAHDTARIVQCMLKHSPAEIRREISQNLIPLVSRMATSRYAHFCVSRMIKYGTPDIKQKVIEATFGHILKLMSQAHSSAIVDTIYTSWASSQEKAYMRQEFYGDLYKASKDKNVKCIADTYKDSPHMKLAILNAVKANLNHVVNKKLVDNSLIHAVLLDYLNECNEEDRNELITAYSPYIPSLASTKDGVRASMICFWNSIVKDRRAIVKTLREHLTKLCTHEHGHILILAIVNSMDDTKALKKAIFDHIFSQIEVVVSTEWGRRIIEWFVAPGDTTVFHPQITAFLEEGLKFSKKDKDTRRAELLEAVEEPLCKAIAENPSFWLRGGHTALATAAILKNCKSDNLKMAFDALSKVVCNVEWKVAEKEVVEEIPDAENGTATKIVDGASVTTTATTKIKKKKVFVGNEEEKPEPLAKTDELILGVEHAGLHIALKKILKLGKDVNDSIKFSTSLVNNLTEEVIENWLPLNRASFLLLNAYENADTEVQQKLKALIASKTAVLKKQKHAASKLIFKNLHIN